MAQESINVFSHDKMFRASAARVSVGCIYENAEENEFSIPL